jgi:phage recombination protein Bet
MGANDFRDLRTRIGERYGIDPAEVFKVMRATCFKQKETKQGNQTIVVEVTDDHCIALLAVADSYKLNPFVRELFAFPDKAGIVPVVSVDGWTKLITGHEDYDGLEFRFAETMASGLKGLVKKMPEWGEVEIWSKRRTRSLVIREWAEEVYRPPFEGTSQYGNRETYTVGGPWQSHPRRMLRHKTYIQGGRMAFGFGGLADGEDLTPEVVDMGRAEELAREAAGADRSTVYMPQALENNPSPTMSEYLGGAFAAATDERQAERVERVQTGAPAASQAATPAAGAAELPKRRPGRPTKAETEERRRAEELAAQQNSAPPPADNEESGETQLTSGAADPRQLDAFDEAAGSRVEPASKGAGSPASAPPAERSSNAPPAGREPGSDDDEAGLPPDEPVSPGALRVLERKLSIAGRTEVDLKAHFGFGLSGVTKRNWDAVNKWVIQ